MRTMYKVLLINLGVAVLFTLLVFAGTGSVNSSDAFAAFGLVALAGGCIDLLIAVLMFIVKRKELGLGFLLSCGVLILLGFASCSQVTFNFR